MRRPSIVAAAAAAACVLLVPAAGEAQYFGRNKVQYEDLRFRVLRTEHFDLHHHLGDTIVARDAARMSERWYGRLSDVMTHGIRTRQPVILYADHAGFQQTNVIEGLLEESTGGVTESLQRRVAMPLDITYGDTDHVLGHELVHAFQYDIAMRTGGISRMSQLPLWAIEGMAEYLTLGRHHVHTAMWLRDAVLHDDIPTLRKLSTDPRYFPYRFGHAVWAYIGGRWGDDRIAEVYRAALREGFDRGLTRILDIQPDTLSRQWRDALVATYSPLLEGRTRPDSLGRRIAGGRRAPGEMMLGPALSPDGRFVAFMWARDFSMDLYLADARSGEVVRRLASGAAQSRFDAVSYTGTAGTWSPDGTRLAAVVFAGGRQELAIIEVTSGSIERRIRVDDVTAITTPAWSPDGRSIAFSGTSGGRRDLYLLDAASGKARRLTDDVYAEVQPAWSPDGRTLAFVTDRGDAVDLERLAHAPLRIALHDVTSGDTRILTLTEGPNTDPQFSPDGRSLWFIAAPDGFRDLYRTDLETGELTRVTRVATGIAGLTPASPALSVAARTGDIAFTLFDRRSYLIATLDGGEAADAANLIAAGEAGVDVDGAVLPPADGVGTVERYLADSGGLPDPAEFTAEDYRAKPKLSYVGAPSLGVGIDRYSTGVYASFEMYFTDVLGNHGVYVNPVANGGLGELGGQAFYENRSRRLNWGVGIGHVPYVNRAVWAQPVRVNETTNGRLITDYRERLVYDLAQVSTRYPLSMTRRIELSAGAQRISYDVSVKRRIEVGGQTVDEIVDAIPTQRLDVVQTGVALVGDRSVFGIASPVDGARYRFEIEPTFGSLDFVSALADWRHYTYRRPFTFAVRALHYGRYGPDAQRAELGSLFLGGQGLVRGYDYNSYSAADCTSERDGPTGCAALDRLFGSRIAVAGAELRVPLFGNERFGLFSGGFLPTELAAFVDAGVAWSGERALSFDPGSPFGPVVSAGLSARFNLLGAMIVETYYAVPLQRSTGGRFGLQLEPGW